VNERGLLDGSFILLEDETGGALRFPDKKGRLCRGSLKDRREVSFTERLRGFPLSPILGGSLILLEDETGGALRFPDKKGRLC